MFLRSQTQLIHKRKWDYIIVLDACRFDFFKECWAIPAPRKVMSPASNTLTWLERTFPRRYPYTVYSANPYVNNLSEGYSYLAKDHFARVIDLWDKGWNERWGSVLPRTVFEYCKDAKSPAIIWFLQPHVPYLHVQWNVSHRVILRPSKYLYNVENIRSAYQKNLEYAMLYVHRLLAVLKGHIAITSDHGELLGEYGRRGHPRHMKVPELRHVPFVEVFRG